MYYYLGLLLLLIARSVEPIGMYADSCGGVAPTASGVRLRRYPARERGWLPVPESKRAAVLKDCGAAASERTRSWY
jgi:hypothetical protein